MEEFVATGRRKTAVASVRLRKGHGKVEVNGKDIKDYFPLDIQVQTVLAPLEIVKKQNQYDMLIRTKGGGIEAQAKAARLGLARALVEESEDRKVDLKSVGFLTRDSRKKERKKYGRPKARKRFQFSKR